MKNEVMALRAEFDAFRATEIGAAFQEFVVAHSNACSQDTHWQGTDAGLEKIWDASRNAETELRRLIMAQSAEIARPRAEVEKLQANESKWLDACIARDRSLAKALEEVRGLRAALEFGLEEISDWPDECDPVNAAIIMEEFIEQARAALSPTQEKTQEAKIDGASLAKSREEVRALRTALEQIKNLPNEQDSYGHCTRNIMDAAEIATTALSSSWMPTHRHLKTGRLYRFLRLERDCTNGRPLETLVSYDDEVGDCWARSEAEFNDGRFEKLSAALSPKTEEAKTDGV